MAYIFQITQSLDFKELIEKTRLPRWVAPESMVKPMALMSSGGLRIWSDISVTLGRPSGTRIAFRTLPSAEALG
jgi:hypothetical protein